MGSLLREGTVRVKPGARSRGGAAPGAGAERGDNSLEISGRGRAKCGACASIPPLAVATLSCLGLAAAPREASAAGPGVKISEIGAFHYTGLLAAPKTVRLEATNGGIIVTPSTDGALDVTAVVTEGDPSRFRVVTREESGGVAVCVFYADESPDGCGVGEVHRHSHNRRDSDREPTITLVARVPAGVALSAGSMNGRIEAHGLSGEIHARTMNGDVDVSGSNVAEATTLNGSVRAAFGSAPRGNIELTTNNGNVVVTFAAPIDADVEASTVRGEIKTNFPMSIETPPGGFGPKNGRARLGNGGAKIRARSINGDVELRTGT